MNAPKKYRLFAFALVLILAIAACSKVSTPSVYVPTASDVTAKATLAELQQGRTLYINNCGTCHSLPAPENYSAAQWNSILPGMASRTSLSSAEIQLVNKYVTKGQ